MGIMTSQPKEIADAFKDYYKKLYKKDEQSNKEENKKFWILLNCIDCRSLK